MTDPVRAAWDELQARNTARAHTHTREATKPAGPAPVESLTPAALPASEPGKATVDDILRSLARDLSS